MEARFHPGARPEGPVGAYVVGIAFAFGWSPCIGPILAAILALAGAERSPTRGAALLAVYGLAMGVPFLFGAALTGMFRRFAGGAGRYMRAVEWVSAGLIIGTGILIMTAVLAYRPLDDRDVSDFRALRLRRPEAAARPC